MLGTVVMERETGLDSLQGLSLPTIISMTVTPTQNLLTKSQQQLSMPAFLITDMKWFVVLHLPTSSGHFWMHLSTAAQPQMARGHCTAPQSWCCSANKPERCASAAAGLYNSPVFPGLAW